jgi:hypothetical protein
MRTRHLSIQISAYSDGKWSVALVRDTYEAGRRVGSDMIENRWGDLDRVEWLVSDAMATIVALERGDLRKRDESGRSVPLGTQPDIKRAP